MNRIEETISEQVKLIIFEFPVFEQVQASRELKKKGCFNLSNRNSLCWLRKNLEHFQKRLKLLEKRASQDGLVLTES